MMIKSKYPRRRCLPLVVLPRPRHFYYRLEQPPLDFLLRLLIRPFLDERNENNRRLLLVTRMSLSTPQVTTRTRRRKSPKKALAHHQALAAEEIDDISAKI
jgi:hypothetical protein